MAPTANASKTAPTTDYDTNNVRRTKATTTSTSGGPLGRFLAALTRRKPMDCRTDTSLNRCLNLLDLTSLGVGSTLGLGLYVLAGQVASNKAGPGVVVSFGLAAVASAFSALCYAEFAGRVPKAGSAYAYSYITVGEFVAFVIGWNLILEYVIGAASVARGFSGYLRFVFERLAARPELAGAPNSTAGHLGAPAAAAARLAANITTQASDATTTSWANPMVDYVVSYFDWPSVAIVLVLTAFILFGVKESTHVTLAFTAVNLLVVATVVLASLPHLDLANWRLTSEQLPPGAQFGRGGFLPYGWSGVLAGSATCFFGFIGFDTIASSAEEARAPRRNVPLAIILSLFISSAAYMVVAVVQTLMWPYYDQNRITILPHIFERLHMPLTHWAVLLGAIAGLASSQLGGIYPLPRILYSMAQDRLIYGQLARVNKRLRLPVRATLVGSAFIALLACLMEVEDLADMVSIGTLAAYSLVSLSVLIVRYEAAPSGAGAQVDDSSPLSGVLVAATTNRQQQQLGAASTLTNGHLPPSSPGEQVAGKQPDGAGKTRLLDLLITWKSRSSKLAGAAERAASPDRRTTGQAKLLIALTVLLTILFNLIVLCWTSGVGQQQQQQHQATPTPTSQQLFLVRLINEQRQYLSSGKILASMGLIVLVSLAAVLLMLSRLPSNRNSAANRDMFQVPLVPLTPALSILVNTFLMLNLSYLTWVRFAIWMTLGLFIYFTYGIWHSRGYLLRAAT